MAREAIRQHRYEKLVGAPCFAIVVFVEFVVGGFGKAPPDWMRMVEGALVVVFFGLYFVLETRLRRLGHRLELYCDCGVFLPEPGGPAVSRGVKAAFEDLEKTRKYGTCWHCGRRVWQVETTS